MNFVRMGESDEDQFVDVVCLLTEEQELKKKMPKKETVSGYTTFSKSICNMENITPYFADLLNHDT